MGTRILKWFSKIYIFIIFLFLYFPIFVIIIYSYNKSKTTAIWTGFSLHWYSMLFQDYNVLEALKNSITIAVLSTALSALIGTLGAVGLYKYKFRGKASVNALLYITIVIPEIIMGIALMSYFSILNIEFGMFTLVLSHTTFCIPFVLMVVKARLAGFDHSIEDAASDLGANKFTVFKTITFPIILPGILSGAMLAFALSLDDVIINFFVSGPESTTLPIKIFSMLRFGLSPEINALCTLMLMATFIALIISQGFKTKKLN